MARPVVLGNGSMFVGLNEAGLVHDFYYPYVGLENLNNSRISSHKIGVFVDGQFSWVTDYSWSKDVNFREDALISHITLQNDELGVKLTFEDCVDAQYNAFCRNITVTNLINRTREIRLFMHQVFQISRAGRADTALYEPEDHYILDYKGRCCLLIYGQFADGEAFNQFSIGNYAIEGKEGTYKDAEDGELSNNAVEHGGVDSVLGFYRFYEPEQSQNVQYWIVAADSQSTAERIHKTLLGDGFSNRHNMVEDYWHNWLQLSNAKLETIDAKYHTQIKKSLLIIKAHIDRRGGVIASGDSSIYNYGRDYYSYVWPRDGVYALWPLIQLGYTDEPKRFFEFCRDIITKDGYLMHKYQPDRAIGSSWHPLIHGNHAELAIQEDETASVIILLKDFLDNNPSQEEFVRNLYGTLVNPAANFMEQFIDAKTGLPHASYDLWEQLFLTTAYTTGVTYAALLAASELATKFDYPDDAQRWQATAEIIAQKVDQLADSETKVLHRGILLKDDQIEVNNTLDAASLYGFMFYDVPAETAITATLLAVEKDLLNSAPIGGVPRYVGDAYFKADPPYQGNPWYVTTLWLAQCYIKLGRLEEAVKLIEWADSNALASGVFAEQINPTSGDPLGVAPLVWSHAEYIRTVMQYSEAIKSPSINKIDIKQQ